MLRLTGSSTILADCSNLTQLINDKETVLTIAEDRWLAENIAARDAGRSFETATAARSSDGIASETPREKVAKAWCLLPHTK